MLSSNSTSQGFSFKEKVLEGWISPYPVNFRITLPSRSDGSCNREPVLLLSYQFICMKDLSVLWHWQGCEDWGEFCKMVDIAIDLIFRMYFLICWILKIWKFATKLYCIFFSEDYIFMLWIMKGIWVHTFTLFYILYYICKREEAKVRPQQTFHGFESA